MKRGFEGLLLGIGVLALSATQAAATTWNVPGNNSNTCTIVSPNCNTIAQAVTASSNGDTILIGAGTFPVPAQVNLTKTLTISGAGIGSTIVTPTTVGFSVRTNGIVIQDLTLQNGTTGVAFQNASSSNTQITRVQFSGQTSRGIDMQLAATFTISNVAITNCQIATPNIGLRTSSTAQVSGLTITGTTFSGNVYGIYVANDGNTSRFGGLTIQNSTFTNNTSRAIYAEEMRDALIEDSTFTGGGASYGIQLVKFYASNATAVSNIVIRRNQFTNFAINPIDFEIWALGLGTSGATIEDNTFHQNLGLLAGNYPAVFVALSPSLTHTTVNVQGNEITFSGTLGVATGAHGIQLRGNGPVAITGNTIDGGNVGGAATTPPSSGIFIESRAGSTIMPATVSLSASCNRIQGFRNGVSVFDSFAAAYGGLQVGASVTLTDNAILGNDSGVVTAAAPPTIAAENNYWGCPGGPTDIACDSVTGNVDADPFLSVIAPCVDCAANSECNDGLFCNGAETCAAGACVAASDPCVGGPDCENVCNEAADNCIVASGTVCRPSAGTCDVQETCTGLGGACPADAKSNAICRPAVDVCDAAESCDGVDNDCPADAMQTAGTPCRASAGVCDPAEQCTGSSPACPADAKSTSICRAAAGVCDLAETCDGIGNNCPSDAKSTAVCRAAAGVCDLTETCDGVANDCPTDAKSTAVCRTSAGICDVAESCDGSGNNCPADTFQPSSLQCRASAGVCDPAEQCTGSAAACPTDAKSTAVCRPAAGVCDLPESCDGVANGCPTDAKSTAICRAAAGVCDLTETCDGVANNCPTDAKSTAVCRTSAGICDVAESCDGVANNCPTDVFQPSTLQCRAVAGVCDVAENCTGAAANCPGDAFQPSTQVCRAATSSCDPAENCTGSGASCPGDAFLADGTSCNVGDFCQAGVCTAPTSMVLNRATLRTNTGATRFNGRATARSVINDNDTSGGLQAALLADTATIQVRDANTFDVTRTLTNCNLRRGRIICRSSDRKVSAIFFTRPSGPYLYTLRLTLSGLGSSETGFVQPVGPVTVSLNQGTATRTDVIGNIDPCTPRGVTRLICREQ